MKTSEQVLQMLSSRVAGSALPGSFYTDPDLFDWDMNAIWYRDWLFVGHSCELGRAGDYLTVQVGSYPLLVARDRDGTARAWHNSCRHRGSRILSAAHGNAARLVCPYHQWTYGLDGRLLAARDMGSDFDRTCYGLKAAHCREVSGYVFVSVAAEPPDFASVSAQLDSYLTPHRLGAAKVAFESTIIEEANWKLVWENNRECYHCEANHPELCRSYPSTPTLMGKAAIEGNVRLLDSWKRWEAIGLPSHFLLSEDGQVRTARVPLVEGAVGFTMEGTAAVAKPLSSEVLDPSIGTLLMFHYPSSWNHVLADCAISFRVLPLSATRTQLTTKWLVHADAVQGVDYELERLTRVWLATNDEDRRVCQENQRGVSSPAYQPAPYSPLHETGVLQFTDWYCRHLKEELAAP